LTSPRHSVFDLNHNNNNNNHNHNHNHNNNADIYTNCDNYSLKSNYSSKNKKKTRHRRASLRSFNNISIDQLQQDNEDYDSWFALVLRDFIVACVCSLIHSFVLFAQIITLNIAINSQNKIIVAVLLSDNFIELKGNFFKKMDKKQHFKVACLDAVERFQITIFLMIILIQNAHDLAWNLKSPWISHTLQLFFLIYVSEFIVDWLKHVFIHKYNDINFKVYHEHIIQLYHQLNPQSPSNKSFPFDTYHALAKTTSFISIPLTAVVVKNILIQGLLPKRWSLNVKFSFWLAIFLILLIAKLMVKFWITSVISKLKQQIIKTS